MKHIGVIPPYYTHSEQKYGSGPPLKIHRAIGEWQGRDKRRRSDCYKNSIICSGTDIILLLEPQRLKDSLQPALRMDLIDHSPSSGDSAEMPSELQHDHP